MWYNTTKTGKSLYFLGVGGKYLLTDGWSENADWQILGLLLNHLFPQGLSVEIIFSELYSMFL